MSNKRQDVQDLTIPSGTALSGILDYRQMDGGFIHTPDAWTDAHIGFQMSAYEAGPFSIARDGAGAAVAISGVITNAEGSYAIPAALAGAQFLKLWSKNTGSEADVNQGADRAIALTLKG